MIDTKRMNYVQFAEELNDQERKVNGVQEESVRFSCYRAGDVHVNNRRK